MLFRSQQQLVQDAGHELRTPLTSLRTNVSVLRRRYEQLDPASREQLLADLDSETRELSDLVNELVELATATSGRIVELQVGDVEALISGLPKGSRATLAVMPADQMPTHLWQALIERQRVCLDAQLEDGRIVSLVAHHDGHTDDADDRAHQLMQSSATVSDRTDHRLITALVPVTRLAIGGGGPNADAIEQAARFLGWQVQRANNPETATGLMLGLSPIDAAVVMGHDVEASSSILAAALEGAAGYIGALGSMKMQQNRADWLAYRGITDITRVHGPAGVDINARTPAEVAISVVAEIVAVLNGPR